MPDITGEEFLALPALYHKLITGPGHDPFLYWNSVALRAQVLASIGQLEFFYDQAPDVMRSCSMALQLLSVCIGSYLSGALVIGVSQGTAAAGAAGGQGWLPEDINNGRLDLFFLLLAGAAFRPLYG